MDAKKVWDKLRTVYSEVATAGIMGNLRAESGLRENNLEGYYEALYGLTDEEYTRRVDAGEMSFTNPKCGYGLAQWTYAGRKKRLKDFADKRGVSIGDGEMQVDFLLFELERDFPSVHAALLKAETVEEASNIVLLKYEMPADMSEEVQKKRASYGKQYYEKYAAIKYKVQLGAFIYRENAEKTVKIVKQLVDQATPELKAAAINCGIQSAFVVDVSK